MQFRNLVLATVLGTALFGVQSRVNAVSSEEAIETSTSAVAVPRTVGGALMVRPCASCELLIVRLEADSRFFIGKREVSLRELARLLDAGGTHGMTVFYDRSDRTITRVKVYVQNAPRPAGTRS